jgi:uncharacterized protein YbjT (DUF2867 family)
VTASVADRTRSTTNVGVGIRVAVAGGTGRTGRRVVSALQRAGHQTVVMARASGVDLVAGQGIDGALADVDAVIDVTNTMVADDAAAREFFTNATGHLLDAEERAGVAHHVLLSILGVDRVHGNAHYVGKRHQEHLVRTGPIPYTIVRAAQFHDFAAMVVSWTRHGQTAVVPPLLVQPVAVSDVADILATSAVAPALLGSTDVAGPAPQDLVDMARRTLTRRGESLTLVPSWHAGPFGIEMAGDVLLPGPAAHVATTTFDEWLETDEAASPG